MRILFVEDDPFVREALTEGLRESGFEVIEATSGDDALPLCGRSGFDVLVTDIRMPGGTNGWDLAEHCRSSRPDLPVVYITGYSDVTSRPVAGSVTVRKPFKLEMLAKLVRDLIVAR